MSTQTNRSNQAGEKAAEVNLLDIFFYLLRFWWLYLLSVGVVLAVALYRNAKQPYVYESSVKIFIKDASQRAMMDTTNKAKRISVWKTSPMIKIPISMIGKI